MGWPVSSNNGYFRTWISVLGLGLDMADADHIQVLNFDLTFSSIFGNCGSGKGQFEYSLFC